MSGYDVMEVRRLLDVVAAGGEYEAVAVAQTFREMGFVADAHLGVKSNDPTTTLEWYIGQFLSIVHGKAWYAMNSLLNTRDQFVMVTNQSGVTLSELRDRCERAESDRDAYLRTVDILFGRETRRSQINDAAWAATIDEAGDTILAADLMDRWYHHLRAHQVELQREPVPDLHAALERRWRTAYRRAWDGLQSAFGHESVVATELEALYLVWERMLEQSLAASEHWLEDVATPQEPVTCALHMPEGHVGPAPVRVRVTVGHELVYDAPVVGNTDPEAALEAIQSLVNAVAAAAPVRGTP